MTVGIQLVTVLHQVIVLTVGIYYAKYILNDATLVGALILWHHIPALILMPFVPAMMNKWHKRDIALVGTILMIVGQLLVAFYSSSLFLTISMVMRGFGFGIAMAVMKGMIMDTIEYGEWKTGVRTAGLLISATTLGSKAGSGLGTAFMGIYMSIVGYNGMLEVQAPTAIQGIKNLFIFFPIVVYIVFFLLVWFYKLDNIYPDIMRDLAKREAATQEAQAK
jgi:GPH family glycoside/pentoside/hexuronide:cation symporter